MHAPKPHADPAHIIRAIRDAFPAQGLFAEKDWLLTPQPFPLSKKQAAELESLGQRLSQFQRACNNIYNRSARGKLPPWIAGYLDAGKPQPLIDHARSPTLREEVPRVIRPDLILTDDLWSLTELDSVPGGIGLTAWLNQTYAAFSPDPILGGPDGMREGFRGILPGGADIVVSEESAAYRPEMEWLAGQLNTTASTTDESWAVHQAESFTPGDKPIYRFLELFDLDNIPFARDLPADTLVTPPLKPALEEKLWLALFWLQPLREIWRRELRDAQFKRLQQIIPYSWIMDPAPLPHHAVIPRLDINHMSELAALSQKDRNLVLKISGFSEKAWGSRGVHIGSDMPQDEWRAIVEEALGSIDSSPYLLQEFHKGKRVQHPFWDPEIDGLRILDARVRLCPYYFNEANPDGTLGNSVKLGGVLATIVPADKKLLHGMRDAILAPCSISE